MAKAAFSKLVLDEPAVTIKPMFGQVSAFVNGNMFCGLWGDELTVRLPEPEIAKVKQQGGRFASTRLDHDPQHVCSTKWLNIAPGSLILCMRLSPTRFGGRCLSASGRGAAK